MRYKIASNLIIVLLIATNMLMLAACGGGGGAAEGGAESSSQSNTQTNQKTTAVEGTWETVSGVPVGTATFNDHLFNNVIFYSDGSITTDYTLSSTFSKRGTYSLKGDLLSYNLTSYSQSGTVDHSLSTQHIFNSPPTGSTSSINETSTVTISFSGNLLAIKNSSGNVNVYKKSGTTGSGYLPFIKTAVITPPKTIGSYITLQATIQVSITILDSDADIDHVTLDFYSDNSGVKDLNNPSTTVSIASQTLGQSEATVVIPYKLTTVPSNTNGAWGHLVTITVFDKAGNRSKAESVYMFN